MDANSDLRPAPSNRRRSIGPVALLAGVYGLAFVLPPPSSDGRILHLPTVCLFYHLTGLPCPGCGLTRSFVCFAHGQFADAWHWHPLGPVLFIVGLITLAEHVLRLLTGRMIIRADGPRSQAAVWVGGGIFVGFGIARMIYLAATHSRF